MAKKLIHYFSRVGDAADCAVLMERRYNCEVKVQKVRKNKKVLYKVVVLLEKPLRHPEIEWNDEGIFSEDITACGVSGLSDDLIDKDENGI